jgi:hypothetical protein
MKVEEQDANMVGFVNNNNNRAIIINGRFANKTYDDNIIII